MSKHLNNSVHKVRVEIKYSFRFDHLLSMAGHRLRRKTTHWSKPTGLGKGLAFTIRSAKDPYITHGHSRKYTVQYMFRRPELIVILISISVFVRVHGIAKGKATVNEVPLLTCRGDALNHITKFKKPICSKSQANQSLRLWRQRCQSAKWAMRDAFHQFDRRETDFLY